MSLHTADSDGEEAQGSACGLGLAVPCQYVLPDEALRILSVIVRAALSKASNPSVAA